MAQLGQAGLLLLLLVLLVLVERHPKRASGHDHDDGHQQLIDGEAGLAHGSDLDAQSNHQMPAATTVATSRADAPAP